MKCPKCDDLDLDEQFSHGIEVDVCPRCSGVWLDRGELEKLARGAGATETIDTEDLTLLVSGAHEDVQDGTSTPVDRKVRDDHDDDDDDDDDDDERSSRKRRKESRWEELADILEDLFEDLLDFD